MAKAAKSTSTAVSTEVKNTAPVTYDPHIASLPAEIRAQLEAEAAKMKDRISQGAGDKIRLLKKKAFKLPDGQEHTGSLRVTVLDFVSYKTYFDKPYAEGDKNVAPACFALGATKLIDLVPSGASPDKQADSCKECWANQFKSKGNGKACGDYYLLAVVGLDKPDSPMYVLQVPPKSTKYWDGYVSAVQGKYGLGPIVVSTEVWFDPDSEHQMLRFGNPEVNPFLKEHMGRKKEATARLLREPDVSNYEAPKKGPQKGPKK